MNRALHSLIIERTKPKKCMFEKFMTSSASEMAYAHVAANQSYVCLKNEKERTEKISMAPAQGRFKDVCACGGNDASQ